MEEKPVIRKTNSFDESGEQVDIIRFSREEETTGKDNVDLLELYSKRNGIPIFKGIVKNAYESDFLGYKDKCPECNTQTECMMSNFGYATQEDARLMASPAGYFCPNCPTMVIDDDLMRSSIDSSRFIYGGVFAIETGYEEEPQHFESFNGEKTTFILEEGLSGVMGIVQSVNRIENDDYMYIPGGRPKISSKGSNTRKQKKKVNNRKKNKAAKNARKRNRK